MLRLHQLAALALVSSFASVGGVFVFMVGNALPATRTHPGVRARFFSCPREFYINAREMSMPSFEQPLILHRPRASFRRWSSAAPTLRRTVTAVQGGKSFCDPLLEMSDGRVSRSSSCLLILFCSSRTLALPRTGKTAGLPSHLSRPRKVIVRVVLAEVSSPRSGSR